MKIIIIQVPTSIVSPIYQTLCSTVFYSNLMLRAFASLEAHAV